MALLGNYLTVRLQSHSSGTANEVIAETTSVDAQFNADALETTSQSDGLVAGFIVGKNTIQVSGDYLMASDGEQFDLLFVHANAGDKIEVDIYRSTSLVMSTEGVFTSLSDAGGLSDSLVTGAYSMELDVAALDEGYGPELHTDANAASDPNGNEADATTGWTSNNLTGTGANVFESQSSVKNTGSYALHANANDTPTASAYCQIEITVEDGEDYYLTYDRRHVGTGGDWVIQPEGVTVDTVTNADTTFEHKEFTVTAVGAAFRIRFIELSVTNDGGVYVDNLSLKKIL